MDVLCKYECVEIVAEREGYDLAAMLPRPAPPIEEGDVPNEKVVMAVARGSAKVGHFYNLFGKIAG